MYTDHCQWTVLYRECITTISMQCCHAGVGFPAFILYQTVGLTTSKQGKVFTIMLQKRQSLLFKKLFLSGFFSEGHPEGNNYVNRIMGNSNLNRSCKHPWWMSEQCAPFFQKYLTDKCVNGHFWSHTHKQTNATECIPLAHTTHRVIAVDQSIIMELGGPGL